MRARSVSDPVSPDQPINVVVYRMLRVIRFFYLLRKCAKRRLWFSCPSFRQHDWGDDFMHFLDPRNVEAERNPDQR